MNSFLRFQSLNEKKKKYEHLMWSIHLVVARFDSSMTVGFRVVGTNSLRETTVASFSNEADRQSIPVRRIRSNPADLSRELPTFCARDYYIESFCRKMDAIDVDFTKLSITKI